MGDHKHSDPRGINKSFEALAETNPEVAVMLAKASEESRKRAEETAALFRTQTGFVKYPKIIRWDKPEFVAEVLHGEVWIYEKIDGANGSTWCREENGDPWIHVASHYNHIASTKLEYHNWPWLIKDNFRDFPKHIFETPAYRAFFKTYPNLRLYGEWLVKHTVIYGMQYIRNFYVFDVMDENDQFLHPDNYIHILKSFNIPYLVPLQVMQKPTMKELLAMVEDEKLMPVSDYGAEQIEGLVFKNYEFMNTEKGCYMKAVTKDFREVSRVVMGASRHDPIEVYLVARYQTVARMEKIWHKMCDEHNLEALNMTHIKEFMGRVFGDLWEEESWNMFIKNKHVRKQQVCPGEVRNLSSKKAKNWFIERKRNLAQKLQGDKE